MTLPTGDALTALTDIEVLTALTDIEVLKLILRSDAEQRGEREIGEEAIINLARAALTDLLGQTPGGAWGGAHGEHPSTTAAVALLRLAALDVARG